MTTRSCQFEILAAGVQYSAALISVPYAKFYAAGTTTLKNAWADKDKSVAFTKLALDTQGRGVAFGDGVYKIRIYAGDPDAAAPATGVLKFEVDNYKVQAPVGRARTITESEDGTTDDYCILANTSGGNVAYTLPSAADMEGLSVFAKKIHADNTFTVAAASGENIDGAASVALSDLNETVQVISDGTQWRGVQLIAASGGAETLNGYTADAAATAGTIPVRDGSAKIPGGCTGRADLNTSDLTTHKTSTDHDGRYYTETEITSGYYSKSAIDTAFTTRDGNLNTHKTSADHDGRYFTETEIATNFYDKGAIDTAFTTRDGYLNTHKASADHDGRYFTEAEVTAAISYAIANHTHPLPTGGDTGGGAE